MTQFARRAPQSMNEFEIYKPKMHTSNVTKGLCGSIYLISQNRVKFCNDSHCDVGMVWRGKQALLGRIIHIVCVVIRWVMGRAIPGDTPSGGNPPHHTTVISSLLWSRCLLYPLVIR